MRETYLPAGYPESTRADFFKFSILHFALNATNTCLTFLSTQALFIALGSTTQQAALASAAFTWVIRDGLGLLGGIAFASKFGNLIDADIKMYRFWGWIILNVGVYIEIITLMLPKLFLPLAAFANVLKNVSMILGISTRAQLIQMFAKTNNVGDISAKFISQYTSSNLTGMIVGMGISKLIIDVGSIPQLLPVFGVLSFLSTYFNFVTVKMIDEPFLNLVRSHILMQHYLKTGEVLHKD
jgi:hypothetical protein